MCNKHYLRWCKYGHTDLPALPSDESVFAASTQAGDVPASRPDLGPCLLWTGPLHSSGKTGYGWFRGKALAHRAAYETFVGPIPGGLQIDHLCRVRLCVRPEHLEPVTPKVNILRSEAAGSVIARTGHCRQGHPMTGSNVYVVKATGYQRCLACVARRAGASKSVARRPEPARTCHRGHEFSDENTYHRNGVRHCRACRREAAARVRARKHAAPCEGGR